MGTVPQGELCQQIGLDGLDRCKEFGRILFIHTIPIGWKIDVVGEGRRGENLSIGSYRDPRDAGRSNIDSENHRRGPNLEDNGLHDGR